jgi:hypothetical protein
MVEKGEVAIVAVRIVVRIAVEQQKLVTGSTIIITI